MDITEVKVFPVDEEKLKAYITVVLDNCFVIRDLKIISGTAGLFGACPGFRWNSSEGPCLNAGNGYATVA